MSVSLENTKKELYTKLVEALETKNEWHIQCVLDVLNIKDDPDYILLFQKPISPESFDILIKKGLKLYDDEYDRDDPNEITRRICCTYPGEEALPMIRVLIQNGFADILDFYPLIEDCRIDILNLVPKDCVSEAFKNICGYIRFDKNTKQMVSYMMEICQYSDEQKKDILYDILRSSKDYDAIKYVIEDQKTDVIDDMLFEIARNTDCPYKTQYLDIFKYLIGFLPLSAVTKEEDGRTLIEDFFYHDSKRNNNVVNNDIDYIRYLLFLGVGVNFKKECFDQKKMTFCKPYYGLFAFYGVFDIPYIFKIVGNTSNRFRTHFEAECSLYLHRITKNICNGNKRLDSEILRVDLEPIWNPNQINFSKVPLHHFFDALHLFYWGSYNPLHPYYEKVAKLYEKGQGLSNVGYNIGHERFFQKVKRKLRVISTLLHWSPTVRELLGDEAEREYKRIKTTK